MAAHFQLSPSNILTKVALQEGGDGRVISVFSYLCRLLKCDYPDHPQFNNVVHPKLVAHVNALLKDLHKRHVIVIYNLEGGSKKAVYWPEYTRRWSEPTWDCGLYGDTVPEEIRRTLARVSIGAEVPAVVLATCEGAPIPAQQQQQHTAPILKSPVPAQQPVEEQPGAFGGPDQAPGMDMDIDMRDDAVSFATRPSTFWTASDDEDSLASEGGSSDGDSMSIGGHDDPWDHHLDLDLDSNRSLLQEQADIDPGMQAPIPRPPSEYHQYDHNQQQQQQQQQPPQMQQVPAGWRGPPPVATAAPPPSHLWSTNAPEIHGEQQLPSGRRGTMIPPPPQPSHPGFHSFSFPDFSTAAGQPVPHPPNINDNDNKNNKCASKKARRRLAQRETMAAMKQEIFDLLQRQRREHQENSQRRQPHDQAWPEHHGLGPGDGVGGPVLRVTHDHNSCDSSGYHGQNHRYQLQPGVGLYQGQYPIVSRDDGDLGDRRARLEEQLVSIEQEERQREQQRTIRDTIRLMEERQRERRLRMKQPKQESPQTGQPRLSPYPVPSARAGFGPGPGPGLGEHVRYQ